MDFSLLIPSFFAGVLTFLAPCTLPLVPGYLGFISGVSLEDLKDASKATRVRRTILLNGLLYVIGFSLIFILLGSLVGFAGSFFGQYRLWLTRIGGLLVIFFGLYMMQLLRIPSLGVDKRLIPAGWLTPGTPMSSFLFGVAFALGWTPCVGPVLGSILALAATTTTLAHGALLLTVFSAGLAVPFLVIALAIGSLAPRLAHVQKYLHVVSVIGGAFLVFMGTLLATNRLAAFIGYSYQWLEVFHYDALLRFL